jgi:hypothetical protein
MNIDNGGRSPLVIPGVFDGLCGVSGNELAFIPNDRRIRPELATEGVLDGKPVSLKVRRSNVPSQRKANIYHAEVIA